LYTVLVVNMKARLLQFLEPLFGGFSFVVKKEDGEMRRAHQRVTQKVL